MKRSDILLTFDQKIIYFQENLVENSLANVLIIHGIAEHLHRYDEVTKKLNEAKYNVFRFDLRGHGRTSGKRGYVKNLNVILTDINNIITMIRTNYPGKIFLLGHSLGGGIANIYASTYSDIDGYISSGAASDMVPQLIPFKVIPYQLLKWVTIKNNLSTNSLATIKEVEIAYEQDPYVLKKYKLGYLGEVMIKGSKVLKANYQNILMPVLIMHGAKDPIVPAEFSQNLFEKVKSSDKELLIFQESLHEIYNDLEKEVVINKTIEWLNRHV